MLSNVTTIPVHKCFLFPTSRKERRTCMYLNIAWEETKRNCALLYYLIYMLSNLSYGCLIYMLFNVYAIQFIYNFVFYAV